MNEEQLINIETKLAHQENLLAELDNALANQQVQIGNLEHLCQTLIERIRAISETGAGDSADDEKPPHY